MKTWWNYSFLFILSILIPLIGMGPTLIKGEKAFGGGPIRQAVVNFVMPVLPEQKQTELANYFLTTDEIGEITLYMPFAINMMLILSWISFLIALTMMAFSNAIYKDKFKRKRDNLKN